MSDHDETPKIEILDLTGFDEFVARLRANYRPVQDIKIFPLDPVPEMSGSMRTAEEAFFASGGTDISAHASAQELLDFVLTDSGKRWGENRYTFHVTDGDVNLGFQGNHGECLARFLQDHPTDDSPQSEPKGS